LFQEIYIKIGIEATEERPHFFDDVAARSFHKDFDSEATESEIKDTIEFSHPGTVEISGGSAKHLLNALFGVYGLAIPIADDLVQEHPEE
jgi:hypothetical protein